MSKIKGKDKLFKQFDQLKNLDNTDAVMEGGEVLKNESQKNAPFVTGFLRRSHKLFLVSKNTIELVVEALYSAFVEFGTYKTDAQPYLRPAIDTHGDAISKEVGMNVEKEIKSNIL